MSQNNNRGIKVFLYSSVLFLIIACLVAGVSYALFTDEAKVENHLMKSGTLDITLTRTSLAYTQLTEEGYLDVITNDTDVDFTNPTPENIFGLSADHTQIAPGSYFDATLAIGNNGDVAFDYTVEIKFKGDDARAISELANQLKVTIADEQGNVVAEYKLSDLNSNANCVVKQGHMKATEEKQVFGVKVEFINDTAINNNAKNQEAAFDLIVSAVQATTAPTTPAETTPEATPTETTTPDTNSSGENSNEPN